MCCWTDPHVSSSDFAKKIKSRPASACEAVNYMRVLNIQFSVNVLQLF